MPITDSAKKALRQNKKRHSRNLVYKRSIKNLMREVKLLIGDKKIAEIKALLPKISKAFDKAAKRGVIKKNTASRNKSRLARLMGRLR